nr:hypothetical protein [Candidatus Njordarchaeota archaeon]
MGTRSLQQDYLNESFEARGFCSLCKCFVSRSFPRRVVVSDEEMSHIMDQETVHLEPVPHVHIFWIDRNYCVRRVEGIKIMGNGLKTPAWTINGTVRHRQGTNVILLGDNFVSSFTHIAGFLAKNGSTVIEAMPRKLENSLITKYSPEQDIAFSILPSSSSNVTNLSEWVKAFVRAIEESTSELDSDSIWLALSYGDANAGRSPVAVDQRILASLLSSKHLKAELHPEVRSLIKSFSDELGVELNSIEQSFSSKDLYDEIEDMITRIGVYAAFRIFFKLFNSRMLRVERLH